MRAEAATKHKKHKKISGKTPARRDRTVVKPVKITARKFVKRLFKESEETVGRHENAASVY